MSSGAYVRAIADTGVPVTLTSAACPGFVEFVERGQTTGDEVMVLAERLLAPVRDARVDALLLGCTHYPFLARTISDVMGHGVTLVSSADETAFAVRERLGSLGLLQTAAPRRASTDSCRAATSNCSANSEPTARPRARSHRAVGTAVRRPILIRPQFHRTPRTNPNLETTMTRPDGRAADELRPITFERDYTEMADGSVLVSVRQDPGAVHGAASTRTCRVGCAAAARAG